jgi:Cu/Ag efflux protein CusF
MQSQIRTYSLGLLIVVTLTGCGSNAERSVAERSAGKEYDIQGKLTAVAADKVTIDHEAIPGLMKAMEMSFRVADPAVVKDVKAGDAVKGRLRVQDGTYTILSLQSAGESPKAKAVRESLAKLSDTDRPLAEAQKFCPITGGLLGSMDVPTKVTIEGQTVFLCCDGCDETALADPVKTLAKLKANREKTKGQK